MNDLPTTALKIGSAVRVGTPRYSSRRDSEGVIIEVIAAGRSPRSAVTGGVMPANAIRYVVRTASSVLVRDADHIEVDAP